MPLEESILKMVIEHLPPPCEAQKERYRMFCPALDRETANQEVKNIKQAIISCKIMNKAGEAPVPTTVYVTKMQPFDAKLYDITTRSM